MALSKLTDIRKSLSVEVEDLQVNGIGTFSGNVSIGGTLTYEDVTNIDSVGLITARSGINCGGDLDITGQYLKIENAGSPEIQLTDTSSSNSLCFIRNSSGNLRLSADNNNVVADTSIRFLVDGDEKARITSSGDVGIGTDNPLSSLHIFSTSPDILLTDSNQATDTKNWSITAAVSQTLRIQAQNDSNSGGGNIFDFYRVTNQVNEFRGLNSGNTWFVVDNLNQRVGIGTDNPSTQLHLSSSTPAIRLTDTDTAGPLHCDIESASGDLYLDTGSVHRDVIITSVGKTNEIARFTGDGSMGLNVTPGTWDSTFKALESGGNSKHGQLFFQANGDWTTALGCNLYFNSGWKYRHTGVANWLEMKANRTTFYMADSGSADSAITWLERLRIQSAGYVTMPYQVAFFAHSNISNHDLNIGDKFQFNVLTSTSKAAVGSNRHTFGGTAVFNTSTNTFTAPVNGLYSFTVTAYYRRTGDPMGPLVPRVNNVEVHNGNNNVMFFANASPTDGDTLSGTVILQLAANDAVTVHRRNHGSNTLRFYGPHSHFCGHLIG